MNLNLEALTAQLNEETFGWQRKGEQIEIWRWYGQRLIREATYWEPAEYTEEVSESVFAKAEGSIVIISDEDRELTREDFGDYYESDWVEMLAEMIDAFIPWRDLAAEWEEGRTERAISAWEDREGAWA